MSRWFTSDLHFGHEKVAALRGFGYDELNHVFHDMALVGNWSGRVHKEDIVYILGDISAGGSAATRHALEILSSLPGRKRLIAGNHDPVHPMNRDAHKWYEEFSQVFESFAPYGRVKINSVEVLMSHFPYSRDRVGTEPRYKQYRLPDKGLPLLHGHTHGTEKLTVVSKGGPIETREIHVGVDAWGLSPVHESDIYKLLME